MWEGILRRLPFFDSFVVAELFLISVWLFFEWYLLLESLFFLHCVFLLFFNKEQLLVQNGAWFMALSASTLDLGLSTLDDDFNCSWLFPEYQFAIMAPGNLWLFKLSPWRLVAPLDFKFFNNILPLWAFQFGLLSSNVSNFRASVNHGQSGSTWCLCRGWVPFEYISLHWTRAL